MSAQSCLPLNLLLKDPRFQKLQEWYPKTEPYTLKTRLERFRNEVFGSQKAADNWYPDEQFKAAFTAFMHRANREAKLEKIEKSTTTGERLRNFNAVLSAYSRGQLHDAIDRVVEDFVNVLEYGKKNNPGKRADRVVKNLGGWKKIMDAIFDNYSKVTGDSIFEELKGTQQLEPAKEAELKEYAKRIALELNTMAKFKEHLVARAAGRISELTGVQADFDGLIADWKEAADREVSDDADEQNREDDDAKKGASYVDVRLKRITQTLSAEAKRIIGDITMLDDKGKPVTTIFGLHRMMDYSQVAYPLYRTMVSANPLNFMDKIKEASLQYPWMKELYDKLNGNTPAKWKMRAVIYTNFKKAQNRYYTIYIDDKLKYKTGLANSVAKGSTVVRHMHNNMIGGISLGSPYQIYDANGGIRRDLNYTKVQDDLQVITNLLEGVEMREGHNPADAYGAQNGRQEAYWGMSGEDSMKEFLRLHSEEIDKLVDYARGVGLDIYREDLEKAALTEMPETKDFPLDKNRLSVLVSGINAVYGQAKSGHYEDADTLTTVITNAGKKINFAIARALYDEVEDRTLVNGKSIADLQNPNVVHQIADILSNSENLTDKAYQTKLMDEFGQYEGYSHKGQLVGWLGELYNNPSAAQQFEVVNMLNFSNVEYAKLNDGQRKLAPFLMWKENDRSVYELPIQADYEHSYEFVRFQNGSGLGFISTGDNSNAAQKELFGSTKVPLYYRADDGSEMWSTDAPIVDAFRDEVMAELERIESIEARENRPHKKLPLYETQGKLFSVFPAFNYNNFREKYYGYESDVEKDEFVRKQICEQLQRIFSNDVAKFLDSEISGNPLLDLFKNGKLTATAMGDFQEFSLNYYYARVQMDRLFTGGFSHFSSTVEYEKRCAFLHAPHTSMYTEGMPTERSVVYIGDDVTASKFLEQEIAFADQLVKMGCLTPLERNAMVDTYRSITSTDGQGFVTMDAYIRTQKALGEWDDNVQGVALERIRNGNPKREDIQMFFGNTTKLVGAGFQHVPTVEGMKPVRNPFFHKYSEIPLLSAEFGKYSMQAQSEFSKGLSKAADELKKKGIEVDLFLFKSGCKIGSNSVLYPAARKGDVRVYDTAKKISDYLVENISGNPDIYVQKVPMQYYGKAATLPQFKEDEKITTSSQSYKAVFTDIESGQMVNVGGREREASWARDEHDRIESAKIIDAYRKVCDLMGDKKELERIFQKELASKSYSSEETMYALSLLENGEFAAHLFTPSFAKDVQNMLFSIISQRMTRRASRGAHLAQFTSVGMDASSAPWSESELAPEDQLGIVFEGEGENLSCVGIESYLPIWDSKFEIFADENGAISPAVLRQLVDSGAIQKETLYFEGYRTPSDHTHSILPLIAKGMSSKVVGGRIGISKEAMKMTGHDYDGDEMNCHFNELELVWDAEKLKKAYAEVLNRQFEGESILDENLSEEDFLKKIGNNDGKNRITRALDKAGIKWRDAVRIQVVNYNFDASPMAEENRSEAARNNAQLALRRSVLTSPSGSRRLFIPGSNDETTIFAKTLDLNRRLNAGEITAQALYDAQDKINSRKDPNEEKINLNLSDAVTTFESLSQLKIDDISALYDSVNAGVSPYSFAYSVDAYKRVIGGASLIPVFALYSGASQMFQRAGLYYRERESKSGYRTHVGFFGKRIGSLYQVRNNDGVLSSLLMSRMVQSAVDNNKNPILGMLNQTQRLASMMNFLCAAGLSEKQLHLVFNQPAIVELVNRMSRRDSKGLVAEARKLMQEIDKPTGTGSLIQKQYLALEDLQGTGESSYIKGAALSYPMIDNATKEVKSLQINLLQSFIHLNSAAEDLTELVRTTRPEASSATVGPDISNTAVKLARLENLRKKAETGKCRIGGIETVLDPVETDEAMSDEEIYDQLNSKSPISRVTALNSLMYDNVMSWMRQYFPQARMSWVDLATRLASRYEYRSLQEGTIRQIMNDMLTWKVLSNSSFAGDIAARRKELLENLPTKVRNLKKAVKTARGVIRNGGNPTNEMAASLVDNAFLKKLSPFKTRIMFRPGGVVTSELRDQFVSGWAELVESPYEEVRKLATDLYEYNILTNGMRFGMYEFAHLAPMSVMQAVPSLSSALDNVLRSDFESGSAETKNFVRQYYMNHWQDDKLVPVYKEEEMPNGIREQFKLKTIDTKLYEHKEDIPVTIPLNQIKKKFYIVVKRPPLDSKKKKRDALLYRVIVNEDGTVKLQQVAQLGTRGKHGQVTVDYNPQVSYRYFDIDETKVKSNTDDVLANEPDFGNDPSAQFSLRSMQDDGRGDPFGNLRGEESDEREDPFGSLRGPQEHANAVERVQRTRQLSESADSRNDEVLSQLEEQGYPIDYGEYGFNPEEIDEDIRPIDSYEEMYDEPEEENEEEEEVDSNGKEFYIAQSDGSDVEIFREPLRPWSIRRARKQRAYVQLRKAIEKILADNGISIGVLDDMEARMDGLYGVTDFDKAHVVVEGLKEMIRLRDGVGGLIALPEEFGHLAIGMLGYNHPLVSRLLSTLESDEASRREAFQGQFEEYEELYKNDKRKLTEEAAGKLVAKALLREQEIQSSKIRSIMRRVVEAIRELLGRLGLRQIEDAQYDAEQVAGKLARELLSGRLASEMDLRNISETGVYYKKAKQDITDWNDVVSKVIKIEERRLKILDTRLAYRKNKASDASVIATKKQIEMLKDLHRKHKTEEAIISYFGDAMDFLKSTNDTVEKIANGGYSANAACKRLDIIRDTVDGFKLAIKAVNDAVNSGELVPSKNLTSAISHINQYCIELTTETDRLGLLYFQGTMRSFYGNDGLEVAIGKERGKKISIEKMTTEAPGDIGFVARWVHSVGNCPDLILKGMDGIVRAAKQKARASTLNLKAEVDVAYAALVRETDSKDQSFLFEYKVGKDGKRHKTGNFLSENDAKNVLSAAQYNYYTAVMKMKHEIDKLLPESLVSDRKIIMMRKNAMEKAAESKDVKSKAKYVWEAVKNLVMDTSDDIDFDHQEVEVSFRGNRVDRLPVLYTKKGKSESYDDMVDDVATALLAYGSMANEYAQLNNIIGELENAKYMAAKRRVQQKTGSRQQRETVSDEDIMFHEPFTIEQAKTRIQDLMNDFFNMHVYGHIRAEEGTFGRTRISKSKTVQTINAATSISQLGFNLTQRIANLSVGQAQILIQAGKNGLFSMGDIAWATKEYMVQTADRLLESGQLMPDNYLSLFSERFDIRQDNGRIYKDRKYNSKWISRVFNGNIIYAGLTAGEDVLACTTAMALARNTKVLNAEGKEDNLWNAYEVKYVDAENKTGAHLELKKGWTNLDGSPITEADERKFTSKCAGVNFDLQGIYNLDDKSALQQYAFGSLLMMYRKWMAPALKLRYQGTHYDALRGTWEEGYHTTAAKYVWNSILDIINKTQAISNSFQVNWNKLTPYEKTNIHKSLREFGILTGALAAVALLEKLGPDDDDKDKNKLLAWNVNMLIYQLYRLRNELGAMAPTPLLVQEGLKILKSPFAALSLVKNMLEIWKLFLPKNYKTVVKSGAYKGHTKAYQYFWNMPILSMRKQVMHFIDPSPGINYYKNDTQI